MNLRYPLIICLLDDRSYMIYSLEEFEKFDKFKSKVLKYVLYKKQKICNFGNILCTLADFIIINI